MSHDPARVLDKYRKPDERDLSGPQRAASAMVAWVRLCADQGTRLVDEIAAWRQEAHRANDIAERHAAAMERLADTLGGAEGTDGEA